MTTKILALVLLAAMYVVMIGFARWRVYAVLAVAALYLVTGILPLPAVLPAINWNVLMMMAGTMVIVDYFIASRMPNRIADLLLDKSKNVMWVTIYMSLFSGFISAFIDNVATVLMVAPVGLVICRKLKISPVPMILSIAVSSNLQGAATLVGDTTSIMLGAAAKMDFLDFFGRPGIFWAVELGAACTVPIMMFLFRKDTQSVSVKERTPVLDPVPGIMLVLMVVALITASFFKNKPENTNGIICIALAVVTALLDLLRGKDRSHISRALASVDTETLVLLAGMFLVVEGITQVGIIQDFAGWIVSAGGGNLLFLYSIIVWGSVLISAFVDNIPYVATMLPVIASVAAGMGIEPYLLFFGLLTGATLGGNLTPVGASANIAGVGLLKQNGYEVGFKDFMRIGAPFTLTAVLAGYLFIWFVWR